MKLAQLKRSGRYLSATFVRVTGLLLAAYDHAVKEAFCWPRIITLTLVTMTTLSAVAAESFCYGTVSNGRIENSVRLPESGANFSAYSALGVSAGRTHVHSQVARIIVEAYGELAKSQPSAVYVYGETGWPSGGPLRPHRTHQNGLSADFFVPVRDAAGRSVPLPTGIGNKLGYDIEFDNDGKYQDYTIDFPALAEHLYHLEQRAKANGAGIALVILDPAYLPRLFATPRGPYLQKTLRFMKGKPWVRHDEHYHVDFSVPCKPNTP